MSPAPPPATISLANIDKERANIFKRLFSKVLRHSIVNDIFAQIIDGLPTKETLDSSIPGHVDLTTRAEVSQDSIDRARKFCNPGEVLYDSLRLNARVFLLYFFPFFCVPINKLFLTPFLPKVAQLYQNAGVGSESFNMYLLELIAIAIHDTAGNLYTAFHLDGGPSTPEDADVRKKSVPFSTYWFSRDDMYPKGIVDVVGYWAETHIFGGIVVFDRGPEDEARDCRAVYLFPPGKSDLFELSSSQLEQFINQCYHEDNSPPLPLPFACQPEAKRVNSWKAMHELNIYRDRYELGQPITDDYRPDWCGGVKHQGEIEEPVTEDDWCGGIIHQEGIVE